MTKNTTSQTRSPEDEFTRKQSKAQEVPEGRTDKDKAVQTGMKPEYPNWPTSKPGPHSTPPPPGMKSMNAMRSEQVQELNYNQETGEPDTQTTPDASITHNTSSDQLETAQESLKKHKERL